ncbi:EAL domain-containing protein [Psychromonas sp. KJ10-10]|uniref:EAL domain-containing protein n=1 Tax=Psychromonas sp. KJ10-10 TaxID=3391823 RepID=UPI0039B4A534
MFALYNLVLFFAAKDFVYLIYNGYILSSLALMGSVLGYGFYIFPEWLQLVFHKQVVALNCILVIFALLFLVYFLKFQIDKKWKFWLAIFTIILFAILLIVSLWLPEYASAKTLFILMPLALAVCFILLITKMREGVQWEILYIYSWVPLLISVAMQPLVLTGKIKYSFLSHHMFLISILVEIVLMAMALVARMRYQKEQVIYHATHDILVGLPNQTLLETYISSLLKAQRVFSSCLIDIKNYSTLAPYLSTNALLTLERQVINDITPMLVYERKVHSINDNEKYPIKLAKVADGQLMFIFDSESKQEIVNFMTHLKDKISKEIQLDGLLIELKTNMGICFSTNNIKETVANEFIQHARLAIEQNKEEEKVHFYHELAVLNIKEHLKLACDLQQAIRENELNLYHQPQIDLKTGEIYGSELLLRWKHPEHGFISPELFVGVAEDTGLINELTLWVIEQAFRQVEILQKHSDLAQKISVNISGKDIGLSHLLPYVEGKLKEFNIPANMITFELTESVMVTDFRALDSLMNSLSKLGINVAIDDYGTGYSSLNYISQLKFDELKIDKAFILDLDHSSRNLAIVKATIEMAKNLKLKVVAEGVESKAIEQKLLESGCDIVQGYYYSKPLPFDAYLTWLDNYKNPVI